MYTLPTHLIISQDYHIKYVHSRQ